MRANVVSRRLGAQLRTERETRDWTQAALGQALGCSQQQIALLETGERQLSPASAEKLEALWGLRLTLTPQTARATVPLSRRARGMVEILEALSHADQLRLLRSAESLAGLPHPSLWARIKAVFR